VIPWLSLGIVPGINGFVEVDALSYGRDCGDQFFFSVDEFAVGLPGTSVRTEGALGNREASADVFKIVAGGNTAVLDGNGIAPTGLPGLGLIEPNPPTPGIIPDPGDNLDALDIDTTVADIGGPVFFSLDSLFPDPLEFGPFSIPNTGTAFLNGFVGGDVIVTSPVPGGMPALYAAASTLGLDLAGADTDDLDALSLWDNGDMIFTPGVDKIFFSVRRGSSIIGTPDSLLGLAIEEGDILTLPTAPGLAPSIFLPAGSFGLATVRDGTAGPFGFGDDLDALDSDPIPEPGTIALFGIGILGLFGYAWRRRKRLSK
jgi:hypothetical protein